MDLAEVRKNIDRVDRQIRDLFIQRMELANQVAEIKAGNGDEIYKPDREQAVIQNQMEGMDPRWTKQYTALLKKIMGVSREYQYERTLELLDGFPLAWSSQKKEIHHLAIAQKEEEYVQVAEAICAGKADAGQVLLKENDVSGNDVLYDLLLENNLFITECRVQGENDREQEIVTFSDRLEVLPEHDHFRMMFMVSDQCGSLSGILSVIADYGAGITKICPRPVRKGHTGQYQFFVEIRSCLDTKEGRALLYQIMKETKAFQILGSYRKEGEKDVYRGKEF